MSENLVGSKFEFNGQKYEVVRDEDGQNVFASKVLETGKKQKGRPSRFQRSTVEQLPKLQ